MQLSRCSVLATLMVARTLSAQTATPQTTPSMIPGPIASAALSMVAGMFGATPRIVVHQVTPAWPRDLVPPGAALVGGIDLGPVQIAVFEYGVDTAQALASYRAMLEAAGWRKGTMPGEPGGFRSGAQRPRTLPYCHGSAFLDLMTSDAVASRGVVSVRLFTGADGIYSPACGGGDRVSTIRPTITITNSVPALAPPESAKVVGVGTSSQGSSSMETAVLTTTLTPEQVLAHYGSALERDGWRLESVTAGEGMAMRRASKQDGGRRLSGLLTAYRSGPDLSVQIQTRQDRVP